MFWTLHHYSCSPNLLNYFLRASLSLSLFSLSFSLHSFLSLLYCIIRNTIVHWWIFQCRKGMREESMNYWILNTSFLMVKRLELIGRDSMNVKHRTRTCSRMKLSSSQSCCLSTIWTQTNLLKIYKWVLVTL